MPSLCVDFFLEVLEGDDGDVLEVSGFGGLPSGDEAVGGFGVFDHFGGVGLVEVLAEEFGLNGGGVLDAVAYGLGVVTFAGTGEGGEAALMGEAFF